MGVATANSILVVSFARERLEATGDAVQAAIEAGFTRFRPVLMTALAMIIGMAPMALGLGEGGEQNAPLGRAVIGGLLFATCRHPVVRARRFCDAAWALAPIRIAWSCLCPRRMRPMMKRQLKRAGVIAGCLLAAILVIGAGIRLVQASDCSTWTDEAEIPTVALIHAQTSGKGQALILPGTLQAYYDAQLYSRVPGYVTCLVQGYRRPCEEGRRAGH